MSAALKPEDLLEPGNFPDDLKWVPAHYKLHPTDPVYLLIAWHWRRVKQSEDTLKATIVEIKKALDSDRFFGMGRPTIRTTASLQKECCNPE